MDENYLDDLLNEVTSNPKQNKNFDNNVNSDSSVDIDMSDLDDISLDELDDFDDLDLNDLDLGDLSLDELDFDDIDVTSLDVKKEEQVPTPSDEEFSLEDLINEQSDFEQEVYQEEHTDEDSVQEDIIAASTKAEEPAISETQNEEMGFDLDSLFGDSTESEDAHFDSVFNEANNQVAEDTSFSEDVFDTSGGNSSSDGLDLDDLFSALGIEDENSSESSYTDGQEELDSLFEASSAFAMESGDLDDIEEIPEAGGKKKKSKAKKGGKKTLSEIVFGEPDEDDFEEEEILKAKQAEKEEKKEKKQAEKEEKKLAKQEKLNLKKAESKKKADEKSQKKFAKKEELRLELEAEKGAKKVPTPVVVIVFAAFIALATVIVLGSKEFDYAQLIKKAADYFERHRYRLAYDEVAGVEIKEDDIQLRDRIYTVMYVERLYESYENNYSLGRYEKALDALLRGLEKYDEHYEEAVELDIVEDIDYCREKIITALDDVYDISESQAYEIMEIEGQEYTIILEEYCGDLE